jgi:hypothetical protein
MAKEKPNVDILARVLIIDAYKEALSNPFSVFLAVIQSMPDDADYTIILPSFEGLMDDIVKRLKKLEEEG